MMPFIVIIIIGVEANQRAKIRDVVDPKAQ